ncbi:thiolase family protein [Actinocorallia sp. A-T 12471]|uniref:thiolase family protein n=1 Tax=Actinocorallia sp. A-T 12471 TaxID=3089813 RepID=UPI0029CBC1FB|nr:thiolase family protein [Actinocorallia sp. A-T 12471]MDX6741491.1 thiolase family protein [Actinocorallia sp. A-T 12471]
MRAEDLAVISGTGQSAVGRRLGRGALDLTIEAIERAIKDAGLTRDDIDGLAAYPGAMASPPGFSGPGTPDVQDALRLELNWHSGGPEGPAQLAPVINAVCAVACGLARHVVVYRTVTEASAGHGGIGLGGSRGQGRGGGRASGFLEWTLPFHAYSAANWLALNAARHFHDYGTTREQLAQVALVGRANAALNPNAIYRTPLTMADYLAARMISTPFCLYDCDVPADGSTAVVVSSVETLADLPKPPVRFAAMGAALHGRPSWDQRADFPRMAAHDAAAQMWSRTTLRPGDVDCAQLYDGFSFLTLSWLEALGFCGEGESGPFVEGGERIARTGELPLNTWGGQLSGGRLHGFGHLHEAVVQLRHEAGERQVADASVAVVAAGGGPLAGCLLLNTD